MKTESKVAIAVAIIALIGGIITSPYWAPRIFGSKEERAKRKLQENDIPYNANEFVTRAKSGESDTVASSYGRRQARSRWWALLPTLATVSVQTCTRVGKKCYTSRASVA